MVQRLASVVPLGSFVLLSIMPATTARAADAPLVCAPGEVRRISISSGGAKLTFRGRFTLPSGFDPTVAGLRIDFIYEPEADPANALYSLILPKEGFSAFAGGFLYRDRTGAVDGVRRVRIKSQSAGPHGITLHKRGGSAVTGLHAGMLRAVLTANGTCVRTCGGACTGALRCARSTDTALCGVLSGCELLNVAGGHCMLPYPSPLFEADDASTPTGKRIAFPRRAMPVNISGVHMDPTPWNTTLDGYSPGAMILVNFPQGVDLAASGVPPLTNYALSVGTASATVLLDYDTGERIEHFGEVDVSSGVGDVPVAPPTQAFIIRPGRRLKNSGHYIVAMRGLIDVNGDPITAEPAFQALRDGTPSGSAAVEARRPAFEQVFAKLEAAGIARDDLILAWDFHTASDEALESWLLSMRDETFAALGPNAPNFQVTLVEDDPFGDPRICRRVRGTYEVPLYTTYDGAGSLLNLVGGVPVQNGTTQAPFTAIIPCSLVNPTPSAGRPMYYGHGLLGTGFGEVSDADDLRTLADTYGFVIAATDWQGMSNADLITILTFINDLSNFPKLPERMHQGILNQLVLGHLLGAPDGLASHPAFQYSDGVGMVSVIDPSEVFFHGNSQGGILGGTVMALSQEATRGVLGVPAANFSTLLQRSVAFEPYFLLLKTYYPNDIDRMLTYPIIQQLWDRAEPNGWYHHTIPGTLPNTPPHKVLIHMATSDSLVTNVGTEIMVRSMGIPQVAPVVHHYYNIPEQTAPFDGSALVESDAGFPAPPITNVPPPDNSAHGDMRRRPAIQAQMDQFLRAGGTVQNFCSGVCDPE